MKNENLFPLLIVEDDKEIRDALRQSPAWENWGFFVMGAAPSAGKALELARSHPPAVVLTDIRMQGMSGLDLIERMREMYPDTQYVILSGYSEFEYARRAVHLEVVEYLTKPVDDQRLEAVFSGIRERIRSRWTMQSSLAAARQAFLAGAMDAPMEEGEWQARMAALNLPGETPPLFLALAEGEIIPEERLTRLSPLYCFPYQGRQAMIFQSDCSDLLRDALPEGARCGVSGPGGLRELFRLRQQAEQALDRLFFQDGKLMRFAPGHAAPRQLKADPQGIITAMEHLDADALTRALEDWFSVLCLSASGAGPVREACRQLADTLYLPSKKEFSASGLLSAGSAAELKRELFRLCLELLEKKRADLNNASVSARARRYIDEHIEDRLALSDIAAALYLNPSYLSRTFKKETGGNIGVYVNERKIDAAKKYLGNMDSGVCEIALKLSFSDYAYFCVLFKKITGETPLAYRRRILYGGSDKK